MIKISDTDLHSHLKARMSQRGITIEEIERVLDEGAEATDAKPGTLEKYSCFCIMEYGKVNYLRRRK